MLKIALVLALGLAAGYWWGFNDAQTHSTSVVSRFIDRAGGSTRMEVRSNTDRLMDSVEQH